MPKHCAEMRNETQSVTMQRNLRHIGGHDALPSPNPTFFLGGGTCPPCPPRDLRHWKHPKIHLFYRPLPKSHVVAAQ